MKTTILTTVLVLLSLGLFAPVSINTDGTDPDGSAMLDVKSTDKGFLPPRVANVNDVSNPVAGLQVYDQSVNCMRYYNGTVWSECMGKTFICGDVLIDPRDGQSYATVQIGTQCWMAENLNVGIMIQGGEEMTNNVTIEKYCYNNELDSCTKYGGLYQWDEMMQYVTTEGVQGVCPTGWHLPSDDEWKTMEMHLGMSQAQTDATGWRGTDEGGKLKETGTTHWQSPNTGATNTSGFTALPGGYRGDNGSFYDLGSHGIWWSATAIGSTYAWYRFLYNNNVKVYRYDNYEGNGFSVRCLRD